MTRVLSVVSFALMVAMPLAADQQPVFRAGTPTVSIYATVVDRSGRLVPNLTQDDFEVFDNGKRQDLVVFANDPQPITLVMMLDRSVSMERHFTRVRDAAEHFVTNLLPNDKVRVGSFSDRIQLDPETFTHDRNELIRILRYSLQPAGSTPLWNAASVAMTALAREEGRRVVLVFTDGHDSPDSGNTGTNASLAEVRARSAAESIMVYAIGLSNPCEPVRIRRSDDEDSILFQRGRGGGRGGTGRPGAGRGGGRGGPPRIPGLPGRGLPGPGGRVDPFRPVGPPSAGRPTERRGAPCVASKPDSGLKTLTDAGGGGYFELKDTDDLSDTFARVAEELHHQYLLAFSAAALDGRTHKVDVRLKKKDLTVRARTSYVATAVKQERP